MMSRFRTLAAPAATAGVLLLAGCAAGAGSDIPDITGEATEYSSATELRDAFVAAGGSCDEWAPIDPGQFDADAGRCSEKVVIAVYHNPDDVSAAVQRSKDAGLGVHLLVGTNWVLNIENPQDYVEALGGTTIG